LTPDPGRERGMPRKRIIILKLTRAEADALIAAGNAGIADMHDSRDDEQLVKADLADRVLDKLGAAYRSAWPHWRDDVK
jgi:hypothetical protein